MLLGSKRLLQGLDKVEAQVQPATLTEELPRLAFLIGHDQSGHSHGKQPKMERTCPSCVRVSAQGLSDAFS